MEEGEFILRIARSTAHYLQVIPSVLDTINSSKHKSTLDWFNSYYEIVFFPIAIMVDCGRQVEQRRRHRNSRNRPESVTRGGGSITSI